MVASLTIKQRFRVHCWFLLFNSLFAIAISLRYFSYLPSSIDGVSRFYSFVSVLGQMPLLTGLIGVLSLPLVFFNSHRLRGAIMAVLASFAVSLLIIDTFVFDQYRFHINSMVLDLLLSGQVIEFSAMTYLPAVLAIGVILFCQYYLYQWLSGYPSPIRKKLGRKFFTLVFFAIITTHSIHIWAAANAVQTITSISHFLPVFYPATANSQMKKWGWANTEALQQQNSMKFGSSSTINYPRESLRTTEVSSPVNIVWIVIDSWRSDAFTAKYSPNLWALAQEGMVFNKHLSTGNATRAGIFGMFYGIPATYWHSVLANRRSPVLVDRLQELNYQLGIFSSAHLEKPEFNQTIFVNVPDLRLRSHSNSVAGRDIEITDEWLAWFRSKDAGRPSFSFVFYDAPHGYTFSENYPVQFKPMVANIDYLSFSNDYDPMPVLNRYYTSVHFADSQAGRIINALRDAQALDNTVVLITGDHAQEINDNKLNYWGHNGNFTDAQIKVPFALIGPGVEQFNAWNEIDAMTTHEDIVPTFLKNYLGVTNDIVSFSTGMDLLQQQAYVRDWVVSSSYSGYAIINNESITEVNSNGLYRYMDRTNNPKEGEPNYQQISQALEVLSRFNQ